MNSFKKEIEYINHRINYLNSYIQELEKYKFKYDIELQKERIEIYKSIKCALEMLDLLIKWKDFIHFDNCYNYLLDEEINELECECNLIYNYLRHFMKSYIPICLRKVGDSQ